MIAIEFEKGADKDTLLEKISLTRKQFYLRMSSLLSTGLINRVLGRYCITAFGKIIHEIDLLFGTAVDTQLAASNIPEKAIMSSLLNTLDSTEIRHKSAINAQLIAGIT